MRWFSTVCIRSQGVGSADEQMRVTNHQQLRTTNFDHLGIVQYEQNWVE
jgi:hypothetical protein